MQDFDRLFINLYFPSGILGMVDWCRHSGFDYDQRISVLGYGGSLEMNNIPNHHVTQHGATPFSLPKRRKSTKTQRKNAFFALFAFSEGENVLLRRHMEITARKWQTPSLFS